MIKSKVYGRVVTGALSGYSTDASELLSVDAQGNLRVALVSAAGSSAGQLSSGATQIPLVAAPPLQWGIVSAPAANVVASATKAAGGAGVRHVLQSLVANTIVLTAANFTANQPVYFVVRDGAAGVGTIIYQGAFTGALLSGLSLLGSVNTAMTVEFTVAPGLTNFEVVAASGYSVVLA